MGKENINRIEIEWKELFKPISGLQTGPQNSPVVNEVVVKREIIPVIFVPGIMGSRLKYKKGGGRAWDPDDSFFMMQHYLLAGSPAERKKMLVGENSYDKDYLCVDNENKKHNKRLPNGYAKLGWGGVSWKFYGSILNVLDRHQWPEPLTQCFQFPVYAFGYNWSSSNMESGEALSGFVGEVIKENKKEAPCNQVLIVTHSMGGLVARQACNKVGDKILGVVHGAQPATGAPAAYRRMRCGFEPAGSPTGTVWDWVRNPVKISLHKVLGAGTRRVLGHEGEDVTILLANMPGGLELLPNHQYKTNDGSSIWITYVDRYGKRHRFPNSGDPYNDIYLKKNTLYGLVNPDWLEPRKTSDRESPFKTKTSNPWSLYERNLKIAKSFHENLQSAVHKETCQFYSAGIQTADKVIIFCRKKELTPKVLDEIARKKGESIITVQDDKGNPIDIQRLLQSSKTDVNEGYIYVIDASKSSGDGTVPVSSGNALEEKIMGERNRKDAVAEIHGDDENWYDRQHDNVFNTKTGQVITLRAIENLCKAKIQADTGHQ